MEFKYWHKNQWATHTCKTCVPHPSNIIYLNVSLPHLISRQPFFPCFASSAASIQWNAAGQRQSLEGSSGPNGLMSTLHRDDDDDYKWRNKVKGANGGVKGGIKQTLKAVCKTVLKQNTLQEKAVKMYSEMETGKAGNQREKHINEWKAEKLNIFFVFDPDICMGNTLSTSVCCLFYVSLKLWPAVCSEQRHYSTWALNPFSVD